MDGFVTLKIKAKIYQYTGIFLAKKEQLDYIDSYEYWKQFKKLLARRANYLHMRDMHGLLVGSWQVDHGFYASLYIGKSKTLRLFYLFYTQSIRDLKGIYYGIRYKIKRRKGL